MIVMSNGHNWGVYPIDTPCVLHMIYFVCVYIIHIYKLYQIISYVIHIHAYIHISYTYLHAIFLGNATSHGSTPIPLGLQGTPLIRRMPRICTASVHMVSWALRADGIQHTKQISNHHVSWMKPL